LATKGDIAALRNDLEKVEASLRTDLNKVEASLNAKIDKVELSLGTELKYLKWIASATAIAVASATIKYLFFA
jgi:hypothetical protein